MIKFGNTKKTYQKIFINNPQLMTRIMYCAINDPNLPCFSKQIEYKAQLDIEAARVPQSTPTKKTTPRVTKKTTPRKTRPTSQQLNLAWSLREKER